MTRAVSAGCASPATHSTASRLAAGTAIGSSRWYPIERSSSRSPPRQPRLGTGLWVPERQRPLSAMVTSTARSVSTNSPTRRRLSSPAWMSSTPRREARPTSRLGSSAAYRISSPPTGGCSATGTTSTSRGHPWWRRMRSARRPCSRRNSRSNPDEVPRMMQTRWPALVVALAASAALAAPGSAPVKLTGAGATFPNIIYQDWMLSYNQGHPDVQLNYQSIGSGGGIRQFSDGTVDFGGTDAPMTDSAIAAIQGNVLHIPTVLGAIVAIYNLQGVTQVVKLTPDVLADIFLGKVTKWNDARLASINPGVTLPAADIIVVHRAEGSGTSFAFTDYLSKVSPEWQQKVGKGPSVNWPVGLGGRGSEGVSSTVSQTPGAIGYVELAYATSNKIQFATLRNSSGNWITPTLEAVTAAATGAMKDMGPNTDFRVSITNSSGAQAYPISTFTWLLLHRSYSDTAKARALVQFVWWAEGEGQAKATQLGYAPLPKDLHPWIEARLRSITAGGRPVLKAAE